MKSEGNPARADHRQIVRLVERRAKVLDLGCGDRNLLPLLARDREATGFGVEISAVAVRACLERILGAVQGDIAQTLAEYPDGSFDTVILSHTVHELADPRGCSTTCCGSVAMRSLPFPTSATSRSPPRQGETARRATRRSTGNGGGRRAARRRRRRCPPAGRRARGGVGSSSPSRPGSRYVPNGWVVTRGAQRNTSGSPRSSGNRWRVGGAVRAVDDGYVYPSAADVMRRTIQEIKSRATGYGRGRRRRRPGCARIRRSRLSRASPRTASRGR
ncbi:MAG: methyltransferase domain-containing protein [Deltaproteobacteria bacterium]|nr:methyltransferase domain-containing protein [Deltaproteobacteria bacterium]